MKGDFMKSIFFIAILVLNIFGCGKTESNSNSNNETEKITPEKWADKVYSVYEKAIIKLDEIIGNKPLLSEELKKKVLDLKNSIIDELVILGKERDKMSELDQKLSSAKLSLKLERISSNPSWSRTINDARSFYFKFDPDFANIIAKFNIITQYSQFELLKKQEPKEAERLGIK